MKPLLNLLLKIPAVALHIREMNLSHMKEINEQKEFSRIYAEKLSKATDQINARNNSIAILNDEIAKQKQIILDSVKRSDYNTLFEASQFATNKIAETEKLLNAEKINSAQLQVIIDEKKWRSDRIFEENETIKKLQKRNNLQYEEIRAMQLKMENITHKQKK